ncbi:MAG: tyrosine-type recombinase/integrase [Candidatus Thermoplasmatota archaeon]
MDESKIRLKENNKRTNTVGFFDSETARSLKAWINIRDSLANEDEDALFVTQYGNRMRHKSLIKMVKKYAKRVGLHDEDSI